VADLREIKREVLKYGSKVEVLSPDELREQVRDELRKMAGIYR
jgi:predicted DNA-binding transcriptional regulator YafY